MQDCIHATNYNVTVIGNVLPVCINMLPVKLIFVLGTF